MADYQQNGVIATLHTLANRPIEALEAELVEFGKRRPMALILPSLFSELESPALPHIIEQLKLVPYIDQIVVGLDQADEGQFKTFRRAFEGLPQHLRILWHDGPRLTELDQRLQAHGLSPNQPGKGRNAWFCLGYVLAAGQAEAVALHDCDIVTYDRYLPARLFYPVANPGFDFQFCKGYYARVGHGKLGGRVTRLLVAPLLRALTKVVGPMDYLAFLQAFRYPLSGEFSMRTDAIASMRIPSDWGLEIGVLSEVYRNISPHHICQVDIADNYDHKHQPLSAGDPESGLSRMSLEISKSLFRKLGTEGVVLSNELFRTIKATYYRTALDMLQQYYCDAEINGLSFDRHAEEAAVEAFTESIILAGEQYLANPMEVPFIPNWNRVFSALPGFGEDLVAAVEADNR